ncbi:MAG: c-type cytochrome [Pseudomonadota bacterium]|nr:MAG: cytochrome C [Pseudomonadota bacterium]
MSRRGAIRLLVVLTLAGTLAGAAVVYFGVYNVAATEQHTAPVYWLLNAALKRSVAQRAENIDVPPLDGRIENGLVLYREHCLNCHGAPGVPPNAFALGMTPLPANLAHTARTWDVRDIYWVVRYGIKMTGMPAWEFRVPDEQIWDIAAFVAALAHLTPREYEALAARVGTREGPLKPAETQAREDAVTPTPHPAEGDAGRGKKALQQYACVSCHEIPGVVGAIHPVGPPLAGMARRGFIGGVLPNTRANMVRWLRDPKAVDPDTAMPNLGVTERDAHDLAAFLETLR